MRYVRWSITCRCIIPHIPTQIALDVSKLELGSKVFPADIADELLQMGVLMREKVSFAHSTIVSVQQATITSSKENGSCETASIEVQPDSSRRDWTV